MNIITWSFKGCFPWDSSKIDRAGKTNYDNSMIKNYDILLCDLDAFFASVELLDDPSLLGKPVLVGGNPEGRGVVSTCSYEARKFGVRSAMPMKKALALCPEAVVLKGRMSRYKEMSQQVRRVFERYTPDIEVVSIDEAYLAVRNDQGLDTAKAIHVAAREELGLPISVGVSVNKLLAKIACDQAKPNNVGTLWPGEIEKKLWPLPARVLPGVGPVTEGKLQSLGIKSVRDLALYSKGSLARAFGSHGEAIYCFAHGIDNRNFETGQEAKSISEEITFPEDICDREAVYAMLLELAAGVGYRLRSSGTTAHTIILKLRFKDFRTVTRSITLSESICQDSDIYRAARGLFDRHCATPPWRLVGIQASGFEQGTQISLFSTGAEQEKENNLTAARDKLRKKYGSEVIFPGRRLKKKQ